LIIPRLQKIACFEQQPDTNGILVRAIIEINMEEKVIGDKFEKQTSTCDNKSQKHASCIN